MVLRKRALGGSDDVLGKHRRGDGAHASRNRGDGGNDRLDLVKQDVAAELSGSLVPVDAHVDDDLAGSDRRSSDGADVASGNDEMTLDEINQEIATARQARKTK